VIEISRIAGEAMREIDILGVRTHAQPFAAAIATLLDWAQQPVGRYVSTCPVYTLMRAVEDADVRSAVTGADLITADGMPVVWLQRRRGAPEAERVYGPDIMLALCERGVPLGLRHYLLGGVGDTAERLAAVLQSRFPGLIIAGMASPMVADPPQIDPALVAQISAARPHVIWVGFGSPKQDRWMAAHRSTLPALMIGVGAAFDLLTGRKKQAPRWIQRSGLEWLYRLVQEPRRLWRRYLVYNARFLWLLARRGEWRRGHGV
jgi:N-acetylglucosaminyldiphosphoundecaprenol N-acetyl-beta-D-mannosaminyltransferase